MWIKFANRPLKDSKYESDYSLLRSAQCPMLSALRPPWRAEASAKEAAPFRNHRQNVCRQYQDRISMKRACHHGPQTFNRNDVYSKT